MLLRQQFLCFQFIAFCQFRDDFFILLFSFTVNLQETCKTQSGTGSAETVFPRCQFYRQRVIQRRTHLTGNKAFPDQFIKTILIFGQRVFDTVRCSVYVCRADGFVSILCFPFGFIYNTFRIYIFLSKGVLDVFHCGCISFIGNTEGIGTDIRNQTDSAFPFDIHAFIQLLGDHHGFLCGHVQVLAGFLLHGTCCKRCNGLFLSGACFYFCHFKFLAFQTFQYCICFRFIGKFHFFIALAIEFCFKSFTCFVCQLCSQCPIFFGNKVSDFFFSVTDQTQGDRLYTAATEAFFHLFPQQIADGIANDSVQYTSCLLCIYQIHIDFSGLCDGFFNSRFGDFIECDSADIFFFFQIQCVKQMPADGFPFTVRVSCEINFISSLCILAQLA